MRRRTQPKFTTITKKVTLTVSCFAFVHKIALDSIVKLLIMMQAQQQPVPMVITFALMGVFWKWTLKVRIATADKASKESTANISTDKCLHVTLTAASTGNVF